MIITKKHIISLLVLFSLVNSVVFGQSTKKEYVNPIIISFENMPKQIESKKSQLSLSNKHYKHLSHSLKWHWDNSAAQWGIKKDLGYIPSQKKSDAFLSTFVFWIYSATPLKGKKMRVEFLKNNQVACYFDYNLDFQGWRGAWVAFDRDMQGTPVENMDEVRFTAPNVKNGTLYFDHIMLASMQDTRHHTADFQAPFINKKTKNHWLILLNSWNNKSDIEFVQNISDKDEKSIKTISKRLKKLLLKGKKKKSLESLQKRLSQYKIKENADGTFQGVPIFFERYGEAYEFYGAENYTTVFPKPMRLKVALNLLLDISTSYNLSKKEHEREQLGDMFILLARHLLDQGYQAGSAMGTLHHLGYSMRNYYPAMFLMENTLKEVGLKKEVQQAMEWFAGTGEIKISTKTEQMDIDAFNTKIIGRLTSIMMIDDMPEKAHYLKAFSRWVDDGFLYRPGTQGSFKPDGSIYHHRHNYPAYAVGGLKGAVESVFLLHNTNFKVSEKSHQILKDALLAMRIYCNLQNWPLSLSGRHPDGKGKLEPKQFRLLALSGSPDGKKEIDEDLANAYLRLSVKKGKKEKQLIKKGFYAEESPSGNWSFPYSCLSVHRRGDWMASAMGHSRYLWSTETYRGANMYGRYINYGSLQILATGTPISNEGSGFRQEGWDWNHFPGTTATELSLKKLRARIRNLDQFSGFEEMLLSDEAFAGGISIQNKQGAFGMKLHEHDKYNGSFRARKSVFFFDNRIVALGSNIQSELSEPIHTTLFQTYIDIIDKPYYLNKKEIVDFPYQETVKKDKTVISDGLNNYFFVKNAEVKFKKSIQQSFDEETDEPTSNDFALAFINHGGNLKNGEYEYMVLVQPKNKELKSYLKNRLTPYTVEQKNSVAHIVHDEKTNTTGYVFFEAGKSDNNLLVKSVDTPCLIMTNKSNDKEVAISVADPDLRFYTGEADAVYKNGKRIERSVYGRKWIDNPSQKKEIKIIVRGWWQLKNDVKEVEIEQTEQNRTILTIKCKDGKSNEFTLIKKNNL